MEVAKRLKIMLVVAVVMVAGVLATTAPAQAQQTTFEVICLGLGGFCAQVPGLQPFTCNPPLAPEGTPSQCTNLATDQTFGCVITLTAAGGNIALHTCTVPEAPPGGGGDGGGGGGAPLEVTQEVEQEAESGDVALDFAVSNEGDYAGQCTPAEQFGQTGNAQNAPSSLQFAGESDDFEPGGIEFGADEPGIAVECPSTIQQSAAASG